MRHQTQPAVLVLSSFLLLTACGGSGSDPQPVDDAPIADPAPQYSQPGEYGCDGCPDTGATQFDISTALTSQTFTDVISNAVGNGQFYVLSNTGATDAGLIPTASDGRFSFTTPLFCGAQIVKCVWSNETGSYVLITEVVREDCTDSDVQVTLTWDDLGDDFDIHLVKPGGQFGSGSSDCYFASCRSFSPDWGVAGDQSDNPYLDVDNLNQFGPENIYLNRPENGQYHVFVEHYGNGDPLADGSVIFNIRGQTQVASVNDLAPGFVWSVGTINWPSGEVMLDGDVYDCNGACDLPGSSAAKMDPLVLMKP